MRRAGAIAQPVGAVRLESLAPLVEGRPADPEVPARQRDVAELLGVPQHGHPVLDLALLLLLAHMGFS
jgi:hypothetical protein